MVGCADLCEVSADLFPTHFIQILALLKVGEGVSVYGYEFFNDAVTDSNNSAYLPLDEWRYYAEIWCMTLCFVRITSANPEFYCLIINIQFH